MPKLGTVSPASSSESVNESMNDEVLEVPVVLVASFSCKVTFARTSAPVSVVSSISSSETYTWILNAICTLSLVSDRPPLLRAPSRRELE